MCPLAFTCQEVCTILSLTLDTADSPQGIDSSVIAGITTKLVHEGGVKLGNQDATKRITCFTIQFPEASGFNEAGESPRFSLLTCQHR